MNEYDREKIDYESLREAIKDDCLAMYFGADVGFGALFEAVCVDEMTNEELLTQARRRGINIEDYLD